MCDGHAGTDNCELTTARCGQIYNKGKSILSWFLPVTCQVAGARERSHSGTRNRATLPVLLSASLSDAESWCKTALELLNVKEALISPLNVGLKMKDLLLLNVNNTVLHFCLLASGIIRYHSRAGAHAPSLCHRLCQCLSATSRRHHSTPTIPNDRASRVFVFLLFDPFRVHRSL